MTSDYQDVDPSGAGLNYPVFTNTAATAAPAKTPGSQISSWYQQYLGRAPESQGVVDAWSGQDAATAQSGIENSAEAQAYRTAHAAPAAAASPAAPALSQPNFSGSGPAIQRAQGENPALGQLRNLLMQKATQSEFADPNDPNVRAATDAYSADVTRAGNSFLSRQAESGGPYADMGASYRSVGERAGRATADYRANLLKGISDARRTQIGQALAGLGGTLGTDEATRLRQEDQDLARQQFGAGTAQQTFEDEYRTIFG